MTKHTRVIVIGSGVSGLACAKELKHRGHDVLVVEARGRVGGRLKGEPLHLSEGSQDVDLGGALIHGIEDNPIHKITTQIGVPLHEISDHCLLLDENGWPFDPKEDEKISTLYNQCLDEVFRRISEDRESKGTFGDVFDQVCKERGVKTSHPLLKWHQANLELPTGADFHELGYTWNDDEPYGFEGAHAAPESSWKYVMKRLADGLDILYDSPVSRIQVVLPDGTVPPQWPDPSVTRTKGAKDVKEDASVEKEEVPVKIITRTEWRSAPKPQVEAKLQARQSKRIRGEDTSLRRSSRANKGVIQKLNVGHDQGVFSYDDPTMKPPSSKRHRSRLSRSSSVQVELQNGKLLEADAVVCTLPLGILKIPPRESGHVRFLPPLPLLKQAAIQQLGCGLLNKCAISFPSVFWHNSEFLGLAEQGHSYLVLNAVKYTGKPILIFMFGGSFARELELWSDNTIVGDCLKVLKRIVGKDIPEPVDYCVTRWGKELYSRMSFTYIPPGVDGHKQLTAAGDALHDPALPEKPLIMFAGEHTTPYHPSTMHGAFLSGIREAYRYDLFVSPEMNDNMEFEDDHIYEYTFPVKRSYCGPRMVPIKSPEKGKVAQDGGSKYSRVRSRRQRFANMALRKAPTKRVAPEEGHLSSLSPQNRNGATTLKITPTTRRWRRSLASKKVSDSGSPEDTKDCKETEQHQQMIDALEERSLKRALDSFGKDLTLVRSKILPVYGSEQVRHVGSLKKRWQHIIRMQKESTPTSSKHWGANVLSPLTDSGLQTSFLQANHCLATNESDLKRRRSSRERRPKLPVETG